ncbi:hypothetical protein [Marivirga sp.]|uniref:hypothetical protein n=1 Tax=Marivirga sp. TaxID=2018662 RepID=UPI0025DDEE09|nr:hypothetical protein [Marivirga sp.]
MKKNQILINRTSLLLILIFNLFSQVGNSQSTNDLKISVDIIKDKIRGGLLGQILGNLNGLPHEWKYIDEPGNVENYTPSLPEGAVTDDDTDFESMKRLRNKFEIAGFKALKNGYDNKELWTDMEIWKDPDILY